MGLRQRGVDQMRADEAGAAGDRKLQSGDHVLDRSSSSTAGSRAAVPSRSMIASSRGSSPSSSGAEIGKTGAPEAFSSALIDLGPGLVVDHVDLGQSDDLGLVLEARRHNPRARRGRWHSPRRVLRLRRVDEVEQEARALDMAEEAVADAGAVGGALDQPGDVGDDELAALVADDAQLRVDGGERVSADLGLGVGDAS